MAHHTLPVQVAVYLLALRHPVLVARQLSTFAEFAPGPAESPCIAPTRLPSTGPRPPRHRRARPRERYTWSWLTRPPVIRWSAVCLPCLYRSGGESEPTTRDGDRWWGMPSSTPVRAWRAVTNVCFL
jgi:hypothetical protein